MPSYAHNQIVGDGNSLPFQNDSLDYIISTCAIEHIPGEMKEIFQEWIRALRPEGIMVCFAPAEEKWGKHSDQSRKDYQSPNEYKTEEWLKIVHKLSDVKIVGLNTLENNMLVNIVLQKKPGGPKQEEW